MLPETTIPLPTAPAPCGRCGGPSQRQGLRYDPCPTCQAMLAEIAAAYQGPIPQEPDALNGGTEARRPDA